MVAIDDPDRFSEAKEELDKLNSEEKLINVPLVVFANKIDIHKDSADKAKIAEALGLTKMNNRPWLL